MSAAELVQWLEKNKENREILAQEDITTDEISLTAIKAIYMENKFELVPTLISALNRYEKNHWKREIKALVTLYADYYEKKNGSKLSLMSLTQMYNIPAIFCPQDTVVYALAMNNGTEKIGITKNIRRRIQQIQGASGLLVKSFYHTEKLDDLTARQLEREAHDKFSKYRTVGEYFSIPHWQAAFFLFQVNKILLAEATS